MQSIYHYDIYRYDVYRYDKLGKATRAGLPPPEVQALQHIDRLELARAASSFEKKLQQTRRLRPRCRFLQRATLHT